MSLAVSAFLVAMRMAILLERVRSNNAHIRVAWLAGALAECAIAAHSHKVNVELLLVNQLPERLQCVVLVDWTIFPINDGTQKFSMHFQAVHNRLASGLLLLKH